MIVSRDQYLHHRGLATRKIGSFQCFFPNVVDDPVDQFYVIAVSVTDRVERIAVAGNGNLTGQVFGRTFHQLFAQPDIGIVDRLCEIRMCITVQVFVYRSRG